MIRLTTALARSKDACVVAIKKVQLESKPRSPLELEDQSRKLQFVRGKLNNSLKSLYQCERAVSNLQDSIATLMEELHLPYSTNEIFLMMNHGGEIAKFIFLKCNTQFHSSPELNRRHEENETETKTCMEHSIAFIQVKSVFLCFLINVTGAYR